MHALQQTQQVVLVITLTVGIQEKILLIFAIYQQEHTLVQLLMVAVAQLQSQSQLMNQQN